LFAVAFTYWSQFPKAYISTFLYPEEAVYAAKKVLGRHQGLTDWNEQTRSEVQALAEEALGYLECPPKLGRMRAALARAQVKGAA
jgi:hypothetical protein